MNNEPTKSTKRSIQVEKYPLLEEDFHVHFLDIFQGEIYLYVSLPYARVTKILYRKHTLLYTITTTNYKLCHILGVGASSNVIENLCCKHKIA